MAVTIHYLNGKKKKGRGKKRSAKKGGHAKSHGKKRSAKKKVAAKSHGKKRSSKKKRSKRKASTAVAHVAAPAAKKTKKRRSHGMAKKKHKKRRSRRKNPINLQGVFGFAKGFLPKGLGMLAAAVAAKRMSGTPVGDASSLGGEPWSLMQYVAAIGVGFLGAKFAPKLGLNGQAFLDGATDLALNKALFTIAAPKIPGASMLLGAGDDLEYDPVTGQAWYFENGQKVALQGLVTASPLDGEIYSASPLDGEGDNFGNADFSDNDVLSAYA